MIKRKERDQHPDNNAVNNTAESFADGGEGYSTAEDGDNVADGPAGAADKTAGAADTQDAAEWRDKYLRLSAEFDNYRKRTLREKMELVASGGKDVITSILPVLDDIDRAMEAARSVQDIESVRTGTELIAQKLRGMLDAQGLKEIEAIGSAFDTDFHEAVAKTPAADPALKGRIVDVVQKGYKLKDNVIRHAKVVIGE